MSQSTEKQDEVIERPRMAAVRARWGEMVFGAALGFYMVLAVLAYRFAYFSLDLNISQFIQSVSAPGFDNLMRWTSVPGNGWIPWALVIVTGALLMMARLRIEGLICMAGVGLGSLADRMMKALIARPRPLDSLVRVMGDFHHESFPSGHVFFFVNFFGFLVFLSYALLKKPSLRRAAYFALGAPIVLIGMSRVYQGAHWPSDVVGAYLAGGAWLMLMIEVYRRIKTKQETM